MELCRRLIERLSLPGREPVLVLERLTVLLDPGEVLGELRLPLASVRASLFDDRRGHPQACRDLQRKTAPGRSVIEPVGRREGLWVETEARRHDAVGGRGVRFQ